MQKSVIIFLFAALFTEAKAQLGPKENTPEELKTKKVKTITTFYYSTEDTSKSKGRLLMEKKFDKDFKLLSKYLYTFWDVVSYDHTTTFQYDAKGNLMEKTVIQKILNHGKRDEEFIKEMGDEPINESFKYEYNDAGQCIRETGFTYKTPVLSKGERYSYRITYEYKEGKLIKEMYQGPEGLSNRDHTTSYAYDANGLLTSETNTSTTATRITIYSYDKEKRLIEEKREDSKMYLNNHHYKYSYDEAGRKKNKMSYSVESSTWREVQTYQYDKAGNLIADDENTTYRYYPPGIMEKSGRK